MLARHLKIFDWSTIPKSCCYKRSAASVKNYCRLCEREITKTGLFESAKSMESTKKTLKFTDYDCIGFDLDNTLARYKIPNMVKLEYEIISKYLMVEKGYPSKYLSKPFEDGIDFMLRGLILDVENGNILQLAHDGHIINASHGTKMLKKDEIIQIYGGKCRWETTDLFLDNPLRTWNGPHSLKMRTLLDYFDMPASLVFARAVDTLDELNSFKLDKYQIWPDILSALQEMFDRNHYLLDKGVYFPTIKANPEYYYHKCSQDLINWLKTLRTLNKTLFLITGSNVDFASLTAKQTLGQDWHELFDIVICYAKKPGFFTERRPFINLDGFTEVGEIDSNRLIRGGIYNNGNWVGLDNFLKRMTGKTDPKVVYIGDNLIQDVYAPAVCTSCDTVSICEEVEVEGAFGFDIAHSDKAFLESKTWGSYFNYKNDCPTLWHSIIKKFSKLCIPSIEYVAKKNVDYEYTVI